IVYRGFIPAAKMDIIYLLISGGLIELLHTPEPPEDTKFGINHIAFMSDNLDADFAHLIKAGYRSLVPPKAAGSGVGRLAFLSDPNGARVEILQRNLEMRAAPVEHFVIKSFDHYSLEANNLDAAMTFYATELGMNKLAQTESREGSDTYLNFGYDMLELHTRKAPNSEAESFNHFALRVDDVNAALKVFEAQGVDAGMRLSTDAGNSAIIRDPGGVRIKILDRPDLRG
ncbi:MAG: VOC family protein, partial [Paracoccaceae bacterium]